MKFVSPLNYSLFVNGFPLSGYASGDSGVITIARENPSATHDTGMDGEMTVSVNADRVAVLTVNLMQSSASNAYLGGLVSSMEAGVFVPLFYQFKDSFNGDVVAGSDGYISKPADLDRGSAAQPHSWELIAENGIFLYNTF